MLLCPHNRFGHPSPEVVERLIDNLGEGNVYRTDKNGTIEFVIDGERLWMVSDSYKIYSLARRLQRQAFCRNSIPCKVAPGLNPAEMNLPASPDEVTIQSQR
jgi:hypothetical protein